MQVNIDYRENSIKKFKPYIKSLLGDYLKHYQFILESHSIRNALMHSAGRVSLLTKGKEREKIEKVVERNPNCFEMVNDRVVVKIEGLAKMQKSIHELTEELLNKSIQPTADASAD